VYKEEKKLIDDRTYQTLEKKNQTTEEQKLNLKRKCITEEESSGTLKIKTKKLKIVCNLF